MSLPGQAFADTIYSQSDASQVTSQPDLNWNIVAPDGFGTTTQPIIYAGTSTLYASIYFDQATYAVYVNIPSGQFCYRHVLTSAENSAASHGAFLNIYFDGYGANIGCSSFSAFNFGYQNQVVSPGTTFHPLGNSANKPYLVLYNTPQVFPDNSTHFISLAPPASSTVATTTDIGADLYVGGSSVGSDLGPGGRLKVTLTQGAANACVNVSLVIFQFQCQSAGVYLNNIEIDLPSATSTALISGEYNLSTSTTLPAGGNWTAKYEIQKFFGGYIFGLFSGYQTVVSTTTLFTVGAPSAIDIEIGNIASSSNAQTKGSAAGIGNILASTTAQLSTVCDIISGSFSLGDCLTLAILPDKSALGDDLLTIERLPPWGYAFRFIDILNLPVASSSLPTISYNFSSTSPMAAVGTITFDPFGLIASSSSFLNSAVSDTSGQAENVWQIMNPIVTIIVYLALFYEIMFELLHIDWNGEGGKKKHYKSDD